MNDQRNPVAAYLRARRALLQPEDVGLPRTAGRRVQGLRREEVAALARISPEYYVRLERGHDHQPSEQVLLALADALRLDGAATTYLLRLGSVGMQNGLRSARPSETVPEGVLAVHERLTDTPSAIFTSNQDVVAANAIAQALAPDALVPGTNLLESTFTQAAREREGDGWDDLAERLVSSFRLRSDPSNPRFRQLLSTLLIRAPGFAEMWARHDVRQLDCSVSHHIVEPIGRIEVHWQHFAVPQTGLVMTVLADRPGTRTAAALQYLLERRAQADVARRSRVLA